MCNLFGYLFLILLFVAACPEAIAKPAGQVLSPKLAITSSIDPRRLIRGDRVGPFVEGKNLTITCSTDASRPVSLSWWEGDKQLSTVANASEGFIGRSYHLGTLQKDDSQRHFTCRELLSGAERSVDLHLVDDHMEINLDGRSINDKGKVDVFLGKVSKLNCVVNGSRPSTGSWWEGKTKLQATRTVSPDAITSELLLPPASDEDNGRTLTCQARNGQLVKTVVLGVAKDKNIGASPSPSGTPKTATTSPNETPETATTTTPSRYATISIADVVSVDHTPSTSVGQNTPAPEEDTNAYLIAERAAIASIGVVVVILLLVTLKIWRKMSQQDTSTPPQRENSSEQQALTGSSSTGTSEHTTLGSLDPSDLPPRGPSVTPTAEGRGGRRNIEFGGQDVGDDAQRQGSLVLLP